ncbi:hypothetical protein BJ742DRAFT_309576 [Cladochytrium replicatum]|nr:hypothetical protein BJ742DRAFT_309576 [Cladochytrium replicatum]
MRTKKQQGSPSTKADSSPSSFPKGIEEPQQQPTGHSRFRFLSLSRQHSNPDVPSSPSSPPSPMVTSSTSSAPKKQKTSLLKAGLARLRGQNKDEGRPSITVMHAPDAAASAASFAYENQLSLGDLEKKNQANEMSSFSSLNRSPKWDQPKLKLGKPSAPVDIVVATPESLTLSTTVDLEFGSFGLPLDRYNTQQTSIMPMSSLKQKQTKRVAFEAIDVTSSLLSSEMEVDEEDPFKTDIPLGRYYTLPANLGESLPQSEPDEVFETTISPAVMKREVEQRRASLGFEFGSLPVNKSSETLVSETPSHSEPTPIPFAAEDDSLPIRSFDFTGVAPSSPHPMFGLPLGNRSNTAPAILITDEFGIDHNPFSHNSSAASLYMGSPDVVDSVLNGLRRRDSGPNVRLADPSPFVTPLPADPSPFVQNPDPSLFNSGSSEAGSFPKQPVEHSIPSDSSPFSTDGETFGSLRRRHSLASISHSGAGSPSRDSSLLYPQIAISSSTDKASPPTMPFFGSSDQEDKSAMRVLIETATPSAPVAEEPRVGDSSTRVLDSGEIEFDFGPRPSPPKKAAPVSEEIELDFGTPPARRMSESPSGLGVISSQQQNGRPSFPRVERLDSVSSIATTSKLKGSPPALGSSPRNFVPVRSNPNVEYLHPDWMHWKRIEKMAKAKGLPPVKFKPVVRDSTGFDISLE